MTYYSVDQYYKTIFGHKVYKLTLDAACTCPTRDGTKSYDGCIFCSGAGSGEFAADRHLSVTAQIEKAKLLVASKMKCADPAAANYIAYFQNFTNTYARTEAEEYRLIGKFREALECPDIAGIAIATRPDCLSESILKKIVALSECEFAVGRSQLTGGDESLGRAAPDDAQSVGRTGYGIKHFSIEFGLQTSCERTAKSINRCYDNFEYENAIARVKAANKNIHIVTHLIFGLPGEGEREMLDSVQYAVDCGTDGLKIQVLNVLQGTRLADEYAAGKVRVLEQDEYFALLKKALNKIPPEIVIHRLTGDGPKNILIAPEWIKNKRKVMNDLRAYLK